jgi:ergothioneine biosynthesis protein EgtB
VLMNPSDARSGLALETRPRPGSGPDPAGPRQADLRQRHLQVREQSLSLAAPLSEADCQVQSMPDASPVKWHLAHTTWFFETFVLEPHEPGFKPRQPAFRVLFNSYYNGIGEQHARPQRGLITRPTLADVLAYRHAVDARVQALLQRPLTADLLDTIELGLQHEQQHQELILTDLLHLLSCNPLAPVHVARPPRAVRRVPGASSPGWAEFDGGAVETGHTGAGFSFDNEGPRHTVWLRPYALAQRPVSHADWAAFIADGGYREPRWWLSAGWDWVRQQRAEAPLYWRRDGGSASAGSQWQVFSLHGLQPLDAEAPVCHVNLYEADAYARWRAAHDNTPGLRLPAEAEWEHAAAPQAEAATARGHFVEDGLLCTRSDAAQDSGDGLQQLFGSVWEWTASSYRAPPGFRAWDGAVGEYNAKFMVNQMVLRGGSLATPRGHIRASYRNFFPADARWQFMGLRLARDGS